MRTLITNGHIVTATADYTGDILIDAEKIVAVGAPGAFATLQVDTVLDTQGRYIFPGAIDVHTHMELPLPTTVASDDFETGTIAAACGGTTTILDFANQQRGHTLAEALHTWHARAEGKAVIDYGFHILTRPAILEGEATQRAITLANLADAPLYVVHVSCAHSLHAVAAARARGLPVWAETCPQYLYLNDGHYAAPGFEGAKFVCTPPMRSAADNEALWFGLQRGDLQVVSTDHAPFNYQGQKELGVHDFTKIPNGLPGVEHRVVLLYTGVRAGRLSLQHFVDVIATTPAKLFGLYPRKGTIAPGSDADLVIWNSEKSMTISAATQHQRVDYTPYEGMQIQGVPETVLLRGRMIVQNGQYIGNKGGGQYLHRSTFSGQHK